jgi:hypothetical protein
MTYIYKTIQLYKKYLMGKHKIAFFNLYELEGGESLIASILVTDEFGIPLEFKCTQSIKPTAIQKTLYGEKMKSYIAVKLCGLPLLGSINNRPEIIYVNSRQLLELRNEIDIPTLFVSRVGEVINLTSSSEFENEKFKLEDSSGQFQPVILQSHISHSDDLKHTQELTNSLFVNFDLAEPFERMLKSIIILGNNDSKFK